ncbi:MAG: hypothetical protein J5932_04780 [Prevotella sp.]|nr:hypothetical protein [Prevotella sp.]
MPQQIIDIQNFANRVRLLIHDYENLKKENEELRNTVVEKDDIINKLNISLSDEREKYKELMDAKMLNIADGDLENARKRVNDLIRTVNQCITLLNERQK